MSDERESAPTNPWLRWGKRALTLFFFIAIPVLLYLQLRNTDWQAVGGALRDYPLWVIAAAIGVTLLSYLTYCCYDLLGRYYTGHRLPVRQVIPLVFVCYAFNLNLNALVGGVALRFRLYSRLGLDIPTIARVFSLSIITNWLGYLWLAGCVFAMGWVTLPAGWAVGNGGLRLIGVAMIIAAVGYVLACAFSPRRSWQVRNQTIELPSWQLALVQAAVGALNWSLMALIIWLLLPPEAFYPGVLGVLLISSIAGVITHIPAGLGVLEMIFLTLLQDELPRSGLLAALIGYRAIYFLLPLSVAVATYLVLEKRAKRMRSANQQTA
ncbi:MAG TPA: flippase-like domain-containing protein [Candidatus Pseudomonas excrementavium]|uniref:lysylphosphatidylglycerol synthase domain-containing protein n=1 Tax=Halopseudomonas bauzanensis TaxID=653930 RepID=UPI001C3B43AF|nr:lysylphosphatidylglycerol synthase domain-containing protein [Halopseudomonas bauzanensis]HIZ51330.1 flippase-like domain-containing protein [Candidatus Pseudomonas excrementavium]